MRLPRLGMGTWHMGEREARGAEEVEALRFGLDLGLKLIDTAEMYGEGGAERVVGEALRARARDEVLLVSKFYPHHASPAKLAAACEGSLARLGVETLDLYLYHWRGSVPLAQTVDALEALVAAGRIRRWGVSNFDVADLEELLAVRGGARCAANQVCYNLAKRGVEFDLLPWCAAHGVQVMAYSPLDEGRLLRHPKVVAAAKSAGVSPAQLALAWVLRDPRICAIPKAASVEHVRANREALDLALDAEVLRVLDHAFPPPRAKVPLAVL
jgi:diketogulonate reductase-like aldo/keto reductase